MRLRPAPAMPSEKLPGPTRLPAYVQLLLTAVLAEASTPPALLGAQATSSLPNLFQSQWNKFKWQVKSEKLLEATQSWGLQRWECSESGEEQQVDLLSKYGQGETG